MKKIRKGQFISWGLLILGSATSISGPLVGFLPPSVEIPLGIVLLVMWGLVILIIVWRYCSRKHIIDPYTLAAVPLCQLTAAVLAFTAPHIFFFDTTDLPLGVRVHLALLLSTTYAAGYAFLCNFLKSLEVKH